MGRFIRPNFYYFCMLLLKILTFKIYIINMNKEIDLYSYHTKSIPNYSEGGISMSKSWIRTIIDDWMKKYNINKNCPVKLTHLPSASINHERPHKLIFVGNSLIELFDQRVYFKYSEYDFYNTKSWFRETAFNDLVDSITSGYAKENERMESFANSFINI